MSGKLSVTLISDTHGRHDEITKDLQGGSFLIHAGDVSDHGNVYDIQKFLNWFSKLPYTHKIFIAGNHDFYFENEKVINGEIPSIIPENVHYLLDSHVTLEGVKIYGSPWQPWFYNWAFNLPRGGIALKENWEKIPPDTDILVTHSPPKGILDENSIRKEVGCELLATQLYRMKKCPRIHVFGHIHEAYGTKQIGETLFVNASSLDLRYKYTHKPIIIEI